MHPIPCCPSKSLLLSWLPRLRNAILPVGAVGRARWISQQRCRWNSQRTQWSLARTFPPTRQMALAQQHMSTAAYLISSGWQPAAGPQEFITESSSFTQHLTPIPFLTHRLLMAPSCIGKWPVIYQCSCINRSRMLARVALGGGILCESSCLQSYCKWHLAAVSDLKIIHYLHMHPCTLNHVTITNTPVGKSGFLFFGGFVFGLTVVPSLFQVEIKTMSDPGVLSSIILLHKVLLHHLFSYHKNIFTSLVSKKKWMTHLREYHSI